MSRTASPPRADGAGGRPAPAAPALALLVVCALPAEARALGPLRGPGVRVAATGVGPRMAARAAGPLLDLRPSAVVAAGFCGGIDPALRPGDVLVAHTVRDAATGAEHAADPALLAAVPGRRGVLVSVPRLVRTPAERAGLDGDAVDMESATLARACARAGVPFLAVRAVTDPAGARLPDLLSLVDPAGRPRAAALATHVARRPHHLPGLVRLGRASARAGDALARALAPLSRTGA